VPLPQLTLPAGTPPFRARGHASQRSSQYAHPRFQTGHSRARRVWTASERLVPVSLLLRSAPAAAFRDWFELVLPDAGGQFSAQVVNDDVGTARLLWYTAEFEAPPVYTPRGRRHWIVDATLRLTGDGQVDGPYTGLLRATATLALSGSVRGTVTPMFSATAVAALEQLTVPTGLAATATAALMQPVYFAATTVAALDQA